MKLIKFFLFFTLFFSLFARSKTSIEFGGLIEVEASYGDDFAGVYSSDVVAATVELTSALKVDKNWSGDVVLLYGEDDTALNIDQAYVNFRDLDSDSFALRIGRQFLPFGRFETVLLSDPLTLDLAEASETALSFGGQLGPINLGAYLFNGDADKASKSNSIYGYGLWLKYNYESGDINFHASTGIISNLADSDTPQGALTTPNTVTKAKAGQNIALGFSIRGFSLHGEYIFTYGEFDAADIPWNGGNASPTAYQIELSYTMDAFTFGIGHQATDESYALGLSKSRISVGGSYDLNANVSFSTEVKFEEDYDTNECSATTTCGTGNDNKTITLKLALGV